MILSDRFYPAALLVTAFAMIDCHSTETPQPHPAPQTSNPYEQPLRGGLFRETCRTFLRDVNSVRGRRNTDVESKGVESL